MEVFEDAVMTYISAAPGRFLRPQCSLDYKDGVGGSCPDFVVIDYLKKTIYVVEVTVAADTSKLFSRVCEREKRWFAPLKKEMSQWCEPLANWRYRVTLFVRDQVCGSLTEKIKNMDDVSVIPINKDVFPWNWEWKDQQAVNTLE